MGGDGHRYELNMAVPNGIILGLIGLLVLITPLATELSTRALVMDLIAGGVLVIGGLASFVWGWRRKRSA